MLVLNRLKKQKNEIISKVDNMGYYHLKNMCIYSYMYILSSQCPSIITLRKFLIIKGDVFI